MTPYALYLLTEEAPKAFADCLVCPELVKAVAIPLPQPAHLMAPGLIAGVKIRALCLVDAQAFASPAFLLGLPCQPQLFQALIRGVNIQ